VRIIFVCLGNICRSPTAEGVMRHLANQAGLDVVLDSAGTGSWHVGEPPDPRTVRAAKKRGYELDHLRGRQFGLQDFTAFDLIVPMDRSNLDAITRLANLCSGPVPPIRMMRSFDPTSNRDADVPDPYSGGARGFDEVLDICERACAGLIDHVRALRASVPS
jgi:protein-tyrosine phosphatase